METYGTFSNRSLYRGTRLREPYLQQKSIGWYAASSPDMRDKSSADE
jgi:hypothetical protein